MPAYHRAGGVSLHLSHLAGSAGYWHFAFFAGVIYVFSMAEYDSLHSGALLWLRRFPAPKSLSWTKAAEVSTPEISQKKDNLHAHRGIAVIF